MIQENKFEEEKALLSMLVKDKHIKALKSKNVLDAAYAKSPSLATIKKYQGEIVMNSVLRKLLKWVNDNLNVKSFNETQMETLQELIFDEFYFLRISEIKLCFKNGISGKYGKLFNRMDSQILIEWLSKYCNERSNDIEKVSYGNHLERKNATHPRNSNTERIEKWVKKILEGIKQGSKDKSKLQKTSFQFISIDHYCRFKNIDSDEYNTKLNQKIKEAYEGNKANQSLSFEIYLSVMRNEHLMNLNKRTSVIDKTEELVKK